jgi:hypothetical protein
MKLSAGFAAPAIQINKTKARRIAARLEAPGRAANRYFTVMRLSV